MPVLGLRWDRYPVEKWVPKNPKGKALPPSQPCLAIILSENAILSLVSNTISLSKTPSWNWVFSKFNFFFLTWIVFEWKHYFNWWDNWEKKQEKKMMFQCHFVLGYFCSNDKKKWKMESPSPVSLMLGSVWWDSIFSFFTFMGLAWV